MFTAAQFTIVKTWKQPKCPLTDEWIKKRWYISTVKHDSAIKKNKIMPSAATWMDPEIIILSELSQKATNTYLMCSVQSSSVAQSSSVQLLSHVQLFVTSWTAAHQASVSIANSWSLLKLMFIESVMPSSHLILCHPLLLLPSIFPGIRVFSNVSQSLANPWTVAHQAPLFMEFSREENWSELSCPPPWGLSDPGSFSDPGINPPCPESLALQADSLPLSYQRSLIALRCGI